MATGMESTGTMPRLQLELTTEDEECPIMITILLMGQLQTADGERDLACEFRPPCPSAR